MFRAFVNTNNCIFMPYNSVQLKQFAINIFESSNQNTKFEDLNLYTTLKSINAIYYIRVLIFSEDKFRLSTRVQPISIVFIF